MVIVTVKNKKDMQATSHDHLLGNTCRVNPRAQPTYTAIERSLMPCFRYIPRREDLEQSPSLHVRPLFASFRRFGDRWAQSAGSPAVPITGIFDRTCCHIHTIGMSRAAAERRSSLIGLPVESAQRCRRRRKRTIAQRTVYFFSVAAHDCFASPIPSASRFLVSRPTS